MAESKKSLPAWIEQARAGWTYRGASRPPFATAPGPSQESVWDYPRPPVVVKDSRHVRVMLGDVVVAETHAARRMLETSHPPTFYLPLVDVDPARLVKVSGGSFCEWKGKAEYYDVVAGSLRAPRAGWAYPAPIDDDFADLAGMIAFYATTLVCFVDGERVTPQPGGFYGGWITRELCGPFKGEPGTSGW